MPMNLYAPPWKNPSEALDYTTEQMFYTTHADIYLAIIEASINQFIFLHPLQYG